MAGSSAKDMTVGSPMKLILGFAVPLLFGFLFQQFYSVVDTIIVGKTLGVDALAGVGATGSVNFLVIGFCMGVCSGFAIPVAQKFGAKDYVTMRRFIANSVWLSIGFAAVMTVLVSIFCRQILTLMRTPEDILEYAYSYIVIVFIGIPATYLYNLLSGFIRSIGDSKTPLVFLVISSGLNIGLDLLLIMVFRMGVAGAAVATVLSQLISGILCLIYMYYKFDILIVRKDEWKADTQLMGILCSMGVPMGLQYSITAIGSVILQTAVNTLGSAAVAAMTAGSKVSMFFCCPFEALGSTMSTYGGQNVGAKRLDRIGKGLLSCSILGVVYSIAAFVIMYFFGDSLALMFLDAGETEILQNARMMLVINSAFFISLTFVNVIRFLIQGMGYSTFAILAGVFEMVARTLAGVFLVPVFGYAGACFASPLAWILADLFLFPAYFHVMKRLHKILKV